LIDINYSTIKIKTKCYVDTLYNEISPQNLSLLYADINAVDTILTFFHSEIKSIGYSRVKNYYKVLDNWDSGGAHAMFFGVTLPLIGSIASFIQKDPEAGLIFLGIEVLMIGIVFLTNYRLTLKQIDLQNEWKITGYNNG